MIMFKCSFVLTILIVVITSFLIFIGTIFPLLVKFFPANSVSCFSIIKLQPGVDLVIELFDTVIQSSSSERFASNRKFKP